MSGLLGDDSVSKHAAALHPIGKPRRVSTNSGLRTTGIDPVSPGVMVFEYGPVWPLAVEANHLRQWSRVPLVRLLGCAGRSVISR